MHDQLIIIGASGHGRVVLDIVRAMNKWSIIGFMDDDLSKQVSPDSPLLGKTSDLDRYLKTADFFVAIGNNFIRERIHLDLVSKGASIVTLIHPSAVIGSNVVIGEGSVIMAGVVINCHTTIGRGCIINTGSILDHDNRLEDFVHISPGAHLAGNVQVGNRTWVGISAAIINNINITSDCMIGAGTVVIRDIQDKGIYVGVPARKISDRVN